MCRGPNVGAAANTVRVEREYETGGTYCDAR
jgi:hypothetical protein